MSLERFPYSQARITELMARAEDGASSTDAKAIVDALNALSLATLLAAHKK